MSKSSHLTQPLRQPSTQTTTSAIPEPRRRSRIANETPNPEMSSSTKNLPSKISSWIDSQTHPVVPMRKNRATLAEARRRELLNPRDEACAQSPSSHSRAHSRSRSADSTRSTEAVVSRHKGKGKGKAEDFPSPRGIRNENSSIGANDYDHGSLIKSTREHRGSSPTIIWDNNSLPSPSRPDDTLQVPERNTVSRNDSVSSRSTYQSDHARCSSMSQATHKYELESNDRKHQPVTPPSEEEIARGVAGGGFDPGTGMYVGPYNPEMPPPRSRQLAKVRIPGPLEGRVPPRPEGPVEIVIEEPGRKRNRSPCRRVGEGVKKLLGCEKERDQDHSKKVAPSAPRSGSEAPGSSGERESRAGRRRSDISIPRTVQIEEARGSRSPSPWDDANVLERPLYPNASREEVSGVGQSGPVAREFSVPEIRICSPTPPSSLGEEKSTRSRETSPRTVVVEDGLSGTASSITRPSSPLQKVKVQQAPSKASDMPSTKGVLASQQSGSQKQRLKDTPKKGQERQHDRGHQSNEAAKGTLVGTNPLDSDTRSTKAKLSKVKASSRSTRSSPRSPYQELGEPGDKSPLSSPSTMEVQHEPRAATAPYQRTLFSLSIGVCTDENPSRRNDKIRPLFEDMSTSSSGSVSRSEIDDMALRSLIRMCRVRLDEQEQVRVCCMSPRQR
ncbi:hypothetical protein DFP72DRAFT_92569 [Ephemerocybe angulata]|uniref:Uncharacterized protein n=1 Tax=Ephemerocybe angulata TaxID=980116 RepID=A0A8H6I7H1_9AGAR|nr:hypothetical protein DFP72DRAFT_92569 [Tulosesus angulatus]